MGRAAGIDVARCLALLGIMVNHVRGGTPSAVLWDLHAVLFALLIGVGAALGRAAGRQSVLDLRAVLVRAAVLVAVGLALTQLGSRAVVILVNLAVVTVVVGLVGDWSSRRLVILCATVLLAIPPLAWTARRTAGPYDSQASLDGLTDPLRFVGTVLLGTSYPAALWVAFGVGGLLLGRHSLTTSRGRERAGAWCAGALLAGLALSFAGLALTGGTHLLDWETAALGGRAFDGPDPRSLLLVGAYLPSAPSVLVSGALAGLVTLGCCAVVESVGKRGAAIGAMATAGSMTLSAYAAHIALLAQTGRLVRLGVADHSWLLYGIHVLAVLALTLGWRAMVHGPMRPGPLEGPTRALSAAFTADPKG
ncbi:MAG: hypothetical protein LWW86_02885 [Micrococcales bacterium]|nr:hypothetical protein [Micrococcales bacterium]